MTTFEQLWARGLTAQTPELPWHKDPTDVAWYAFDWTQWIPQNHNPPVTISTYTVTVDSNATAVAQQIQGNTVFVLISGGVDGTQAVVECQITTSKSEVYKTSKLLYINTRYS